MTKKLISVILTVVVILSVFVTGVSASEAKIRQSNINLPSVNFEIKGNYKRADIDSVVLGDEALEVKSVSSGKNADKKLVYVLVDISTSMSQQHLNSLKQDLINYALSFGKDDTFVMKTFGQEVKTVLEGGEDSETVKSVINGLRCNSGGTTFYAALNSALEDSLTRDNYDRIFSIVISDGADYEKGNSSQEEVIDNFNTHRLPVYGLCVSTALKSEADGFGYISRTSGGELFSFSTYDASQKFDEMLSVSDDVTIVKASSSRKKTTGREILSVKVNGEKIEQEVWAAAKSDKVAPTVDEISFDKDSQSFVITFSENVDNADKTTSFIISKNGKELSIDTVDYEDCVAKIKMDKKVYSGEYKFEFIDITDATDNRNSLRDEIITEEVKANSIIVTILAITGIALIPIGFLVALYLILLNLKKKKQVEKFKDIFVAQVEEKEVQRVYVEEPKGMKIQIHMDCSNGQQHRIEYNLLQSMIIGRSNICDICVEDSRMSQQHFAVEKVENGLAVIDLESTNGTYVNGVRVFSRTFMPSGSKISAGNSIITIMY